MANANQDQSSRENLFPMAQLLNLALCPKDNLKQRDELATTLVKDLLAYVNKKIYPKYKAHTESVVDSAMVSILRIIGEPGGKNLDPDAQAMIVENVIKVVTKKINAVRSIPPVANPDHDVPSQVGSLEEDITYARKFVNDLIEDFKTACNLVNDEQLSRATKILILMHQGCTLKEIGERLGEKANSVGKFVGRLRKQDDIKKIEIEKLHNAIQNNFLRNTTFEQLNHIVDQETTDTFEEFKKRFTPKETIILSGMIDKSTDQHILEQLKEDYGRMTTPELRQNQKNIRLKLQQWYRERRCS